MEVDDGWHREKALQSLVRKMAAAAGIHDARARFVGALEHTRQLEAGYSELWASDASDGLGLPRGLSADPAAVLEAIGQILESALKAAIALSGCEGAEGAIDAGTPGAAGVESGRALDAATEAAQAIGDPEWRAAMLSRVVARRAALGDLSGALDAVEGIERDRWLAPALGAIGAAYWRLGREDDARELFARATTVADGIVAEDPQLHDRYGPGARPPDFIDDARDRERALVDALQTIAWQQADAGLLADALDTANRGPNPGVRDHARALVLRAGARRDGAAALDAARAAEHGGRRLVHAMAERCASRREDALAWRVAAARVAPEDGPIIAAHVAALTAPATGA
jgi:hypothetical protein